MRDLSKNCADGTPLHGVYVFKYEKIDDELALCDHDFDEAISVHKAPKAGWKGFLLQFHCYEPWKEQEWKIDDINELIQLLSQGMVNNLPNYFCSSNCLELVEFLKFSLEKNEKVTIKYEWGGV